MDQQNKKNIHFNEFLRESPLWKKKCFNAKGVCFQGSNYECVGIVPVAR